MFFFNVISIVNFQSSKHNNSLNPKPSGSLVPSCGTFISVQGIQIYKEKYERRYFKTSFGEFLQPLAIDYLPLKDTTRKFKLPVIDFHSQWKNLIYRSLTSYDLVRNATEVLNLDFVACLFRLFPLPSSSYKKYIISIYSSRLKPYF